MNFSINDLFRSNYNLDKKFGFSNFLNLYK